MLIGDLFERDVTRAIPPVVYFHEQEPAHLKREVEEYIITGGYGPSDPRATQGGIHEQFVRLLTGMKGEMAKPGGPSLPACWISGFYGSGKSSFAKLLGLALDGRTLPGGKSLADALLAQDHSPAASDFHKAWHLFVKDIRPIAVVFDVGSKARDDEHIHAVVVRELQHRLNYSRTSNLVAEYELKLELEGKWDAFMDKVSEVHRKPWTQLKDSQLVEDYFSAALHALDKETFPDPMSWVLSRSGSRFDGKRSADEAVQAIEQMIAKREPGKTLFLVVDEVSQYVHDDDDRMLALQSFVSALGQRLKGGAWILATGQKKLDEGTGVASSIQKLKDRFPPALRVHLDHGNIRDVVHKRLLRKKKLLEADLKEMFEKHRSELALYAYKGDQISDIDFVEIYPMLPGHIELLLDVTTGLRERSNRTQGDSHAIRGLLQLLGDLFREKDLARFDIGRLITIDLIYDVLQSALDTDVQMTIARAFEFCDRHEHKDLMKRVIKAVAMLELVQHRQKTSAELIARCLYERVGDGNIQPDVQKALDALKGENLVGYSEKTGYKIESSAGQEWQRERDGYVPTAEQRSEQVQKVLSDLVADVDAVTLENMPLPWLALFSDNAGARDARIRDERKHTVITVDFQLTKGEGDDHWVPRTDSASHKNRIVWVVGDVEAVRYAASKVVQSWRMVDRYQNRETSLPQDKANLLVDERNRFDTAARELADAVKAAFMAGRIYWRGRGTNPRDLGVSFGKTLAAFGNRVAPELYPNPTTYTVSEKDMLFLLESPDLSAPPTVLCQDKLGVLAMDADRWEVTCNGRVLTDLLAHIRELGGVKGSTLIEHFGAPPYGVPPDVVRAAVIGLLRGHKVRIDIPGVGELTSVRDEGARNLTKESGFRNASISENLREALTPRDRNAICVLFKELLNKEVARNDEAIADAVVDRFASARERLTALGDRFRRLPSSTKYPAALTKLEQALEAGRRDRRVEPTVAATKRLLPALRDGLALLRRMESDVTDAAIALLRDAEDVARLEWPVLSAVGASDDAKESATAIEGHLKAERPWEDTASLAVHVTRVRDEYRSRRRTLLDAHAKAVDLAIDTLKRRPGFERLDPDQRHQVLRHLREGGAPGTDERAVVPALDALEAHLAAKRDVGEKKAIQQLDTFLYTFGGPAIVEVALHLTGREIETTADLERLLADIRERLAHELAARHRVRIK